jgi:hypothetical protein
MLSAARAYRIGRTRPESNTSLNPPKRTGAGAKWKDAGEHAIAESERGGQGGGITDRRACGYGYLQQTCTSDLSCAASSTPCAEPMARVSIGPARANHQWRERRPTR